MFPAKIVEAAEAFWAQANVHDSLPREVETACIRACPLTIVKSSSLTIKKVIRDAEQYGIQLRTDFPNRGLHAVLLARNGHGLLFVNADDSPAEQRFSVAHEVSHWILHYFKTRQEAVQSVGMGITEVLDGLRSPFYDEWVYAIVSGATIHPYTHMIARGPSGEITNQSWALAEDEADMLALEIIAPSRVLADRIRQLGRLMEPLAAESTLCSELQSRWGLPLTLAQVYASMCRSWVVPEPSFSAWLGISD